MPETPFSTFDEACMARALALAEAARAEGFLNLRRAGVLKAKAGITSLLEVSRVTAASG